MRREDRGTAARQGRRSQARKAKAGALAAASLALVPFLSGGVPVTLTSTVDSPVADVDGQVPAQPSLSPALLDAAGSPLLLAQQLPSFEDVPITPLGAPVVGGLGIPDSALQAYRRAEQRLARLSPGCHVSWSLLASIGRIESGHARGGRVDANGMTLTPILGPILNGVGFAAIPDTDGGAYDGDTRWDRAVGPMQFIPSTWRGSAADGNGDGVADPDNIFDATVAAGKYLCAGGGDLRDPRQRAEAVFRYNHSDSYVRTVLLWADAYEQGVSSVPDGLLPAGPVAGSAGLAGPVAEAPPAPLNAAVAPPPAPTTTPPPPPSASPTSASPTTSSSMTTTTTVPSTTTTTTTTTTTSTTTTTTTSSGPPTSPTCTPTSPSTSDTTTTTAPTTTTAAPSTTESPACG